MDEPKLYRASLLGYVLAVATDGDENELDEQRATTLRISRISEADHQGRIQISEFYGTSLVDCVHAAQNAGLPVESVAANEPWGLVNRVYVQPPALTAAAAEYEGAISFHAMLSGNVLAILPPYEDDEEDDSYLRIIELTFYGRDDSVLLCGDSLNGAIEAIRRNFDVSRVIRSAAEEKPARRQKQTSPWREQSF